MSPSHVRIFGLLSLLLFTACTDGRDAHPMCADMTAPGVIIQLPGLDVGIRDAAGRGRALGTRVVVRPAGSSTDSVVAIGHDTVRVAAGFGRPGRFDVAVHRPFYRDTVVPNVAVVAGECGYAVTSLPITLRLAPGAPPVRSVDILGREFLPLAGDTARLTADVDADQGLSRAVTWRSADTTLARVDADGIVTARCTTIGGTDTVTAVSVADTTVRGKAPVVVTKQTSCP